MTYTPDYESSLAYRTALNAKPERRIQAKTGLDGFKDGGLPEKLKRRAEEEISLLGKRGIIPVKTSSILNFNGKKSISPALPEFLHIYDPSGGFASIFKSFAKGRPDGTPLNGIFLTSSRYREAKIYRPDDAVFESFQNYCCGSRAGEAVDFICSGTSSEAEIDFIAKYSGDVPLPLIILPSGPLPDVQGGAVKNKFEKSIFISAMDPLLKNSRYGFALRNVLAFHLSSELAVLYLSKNSSLSSLIKKFEDAGKPVRIFKNELPDNYGDDGEIEVYTRVPDCASGKTGSGTNRGDDYGCAGCDAVQKFIMDILEKDNIAIDNLLKLSSIK